MTSDNPIHSNHQECWASAFVDGESTLISQTCWTETVQEQLYYYTLTRQVLHGEAPARRDACWQDRKAAWVRLWARVGAR